MRISKLVITSILLTFFYAASAASQTAQLTLEVRTDSVGTKGRNYTVTRFQDTECSKPKGGIKLLKKKFAKDQYQFKTIDITAEQEFVFQVNYSELRRDQDRMCSYLAAFSPQPLHSYKAIYEVSGQVSRCSITIIDVSDPAVEVDLKKPENLCAKAGRKGGTNAVPVHSLHQLF